MKLKGNILIILILFIISSLIIGVASASDLDNEINLADGSYNLNYDNNLVGDSYNLNYDNNLDLVSTSNLGSESNIEISSKIDSKTNEVNSNLNNNKIVSKQLNSNKLSENIITVNHTGNDVNDLQKAINSASNGDIIDLGNYTYQISRYQIELNKSVTLMGSGNTIFNGTGGTASSGCILSIGYYGRDSTICGIIFNDTQARTQYTGQDTLNGWAIDIDSSRNIIIENCSFYNFNRAINIESSTNVNIENSYFNGTATRVTDRNEKEYGSKVISMELSYNVFIKNNAFEGPVLESIVVNLSSNTQISQNTFINNTYSIDLDSSYSYGTIIENNTFYNCGHFQFENETTSIDYNMLPVIRKHYDGDITVNQNIFVVDNGNLLIYACSGSDNSEIYANNNIVEKLNEDVDGETVTFLQVYDITKTLEEIGKIELKSNSLLDNMESLVMVDFIWYSEDGDIIFPMKSNSTLKMNFTEVFLRQNFNIDFNLESSGTLISGIIDVFIDKKHYTANIKNGKGTLNINNDLTSGNHPVIAKYNGTSDYGAINGYNVITVYELNTFRSIQSLINEASDGDTIVLDGYYYGEGSQISIIDKSINIVSLNPEIPAILDASGLSRVFFISANNSNISNLVFKNTSYKNYGGAIWVDWDMENTTIANCSFIATMGTSGGAIAWSGNNGLLIDSNFTDCWSVNGAGGSVVWDGAGNDGEIRNCIFINSSASSGGSISVAGSRVKIIDSKFISSNASDADGGAALISGRNVSMSNCIFEENYAIFYGGSIKWTGINGILENSSFISNFVSYPEECAAGAIYWTGTNGTIANSIFENNHVITDASSESIFGGAIGLEGANSTIINCSFNNNYITASELMEDVYGGAVYVKADNIVLKDSIFTNNNCSLWTGGAIYVKGNNGLLENLTLINNIASEGGAIYYDGNNGKIIDSYFEKNIAIEGGALYLGEDGENSLVNNSIFINNKATYGTISVDSDFSLVNSSLFINNTANKGSALYWYSRNGTFYNNIFDNVVYAPGNDYASSIVESGFRRPEEKNNFWSKNYNSTSEMIDEKIFVFNNAAVAPTNWINVKIDGINEISIKDDYIYNISFVFNNGTYLDDYNTFVDSISDNSGSNSLSLEKVILPNYNLIVNHTLLENVLSPIYDDSILNTFYANSSSVFGSILNINGDSFIIVNNNLNLNYSVSIEGEDTIYVYSHRGVLLDKIEINIVLEERETNITALYNYTYINESLFINFTVKDFEDYAVNYGNLSVFNGENLLYTIDLFTDESVLEFKFNQSGNYTLNAVYSGGNIYLESSNSFIVEVKEADVETFIGAEFNQVYAGEDLIINITVLDKDNNQLIGQTISVLIDDNLLGDFVLNESELILNTSMNQSGTYKLNIVYNGSNIYLPSNYSGDLLIKAADVETFIGAEFNQVYAGEDLIINVSLSEIRNNSDINDDSEINDDFNRNNSFNYEKLLISLDDVELGEFELNDGYLILNYSFNQSGTYKLNITYNGNNVYLPSNAVYDLVVKSADIETFINISSDSVYAGENLTVNISLFDENNNPLSDKINLNLAGNDLGTYDINNGFILFNINIPQANTYSLNVSYNGTNILMPSSAVYDLVVKSADIGTFINISSDSVYVNQDMMVNISLFDENNNPVSDKISLSLNGTNLGDYDIVDGFTTINLDLSLIDSISINPGVYSLNAKYNGTNILLSSLSTYNLTIKAADVETFINASYNDVYIGEDLLVDVYLFDSNNNSLEGEILNVKLLGNDLGNYQVKNGKINLNISMLNVGDYNLDVAYSGNNVYLASNNSFNLVVKPYDIETFINASYGEVYTNETLFIEVSLFDLINNVLDKGDILNSSLDNSSVLNSSFDKELSLLLKNNYLNSEKVSILINYINLGEFELNNGSLVLNHSFDKSGVYPIEIRFNGNDYYLASNFSSNIYVYDKTVLVDGVEHKNILVNHTGNDMLDIQKAIDAANPCDIIQLANRTYTGVSDINISKNITIKSDGASIESKEDSSNLVVFNILTNGSNTNSNDTDSNDTNPNVTNDSGCDIKVIIKDIEFKLNNADTIILAKVINGSTPLSIKTPTIVFTNNTVSKANDNVVAESITVLELDSERGVLAPNNEIVVSNNTLSSGVNPFEFKITSIYNGSNANINIGGNIPEKIETVIIYNNMTTVAIDPAVDGRNGEYFNVVLTDINGNPLANKFIQIGFNGNVYNRITNETGGAKLQINLKNKGVYTFAICFLGDENYNSSFEVSKITVSLQKAKLTTSNKSYKASAKTKTLTASFKSSRGNVISGKKVTFTVNGKIYSATTNSKGVATVKVSLSTKKTYTFTAKTTADTRYAATSVSGKLVIN